MELAAKNPQGLAPARPPSSFDFVFSSAAQRGVTKSSTSLQNGARDLRFRRGISLAPVKFALTLALSLASPAPAETLMTPEEFEAWSTGRTLDYYDADSYWGSEQHLPGRKTLDADAEGPCRNGLWFPEGDAICFQYEGFEGTHCWVFWRDGDRVTASTVDAGPEVPPYEVQASDAPLACPGPDVGV